MKNVKLREKGDKESTQFCAFVLGRNDHYLVYTHHGEQTDICIQASCPLPLLCSDIIQLAIHVLAVFTINFCPGKYKKVLHIFQKLLFLLRKIILCKRLITVELN